MSPSDSGPRWGSGACAPERRKPTIRCPRCSPRTSATPTSSSARTTAPSSSRHGGPAIVVDFGTTTNFDIVSAEGDFLGGAFAPGLEVSAESLFSRAARLFRVPFTPPANAIGKNTADCLRSGIVFGYVGLVEGLLARLEAELQPASPRVVATGGLAATIAPLAKGIERIDDDLTLEGLRLLWEINA